MLIYNISTIKWLSTKMLKISSRVSSINLEKGIGKNIWNTHCTFVKSFSFIHLENNEKIK